MERYNFGNRVAQLRKVNGMTQAQLAEILNVSNKTISRWETGDGYPDISLLKPLANALGVSVDYLLDNEKEEITSIGIVEVENEGNETSSDEDAGTALEIKEMHFSWRRPRWKELTVLNKVASVTVVLMMGYGVVWGILAALFNAEILPTSDIIITFIPMVYLILFRLGSWIGVGCAAAGLVLGELGKYYHQRSVAIVLIVLNWMLPYVAMFID